MPKFSKSVFIFTRDLRIEDNTALIEACKNSKQVIPCFVFNKKIIQKDGFRLRFLLDSLDDLKGQFSKRNSKLQVAIGKYSETLEQIKEIDAVFINSDFTPFAKKRESEIANFCNKKGIAFFRYVDHLMYDPSFVKTKMGKPYTIFSQFFRASSQLQVPKPTNTEFTNFYSKKIFDEDVGSNYNISNHGGRNNALKILDSISEFLDYEKKRNFPELNSTTKLSAHNRFGTVSVREVYHALVDSLGKNHTLISEIHWREFFNHVLYHYPSVISESFNKRHSNIKWHKNQARLDAWREGKTGFPIVDAGMRELNNTGFMHNRVRMIVASFLTKDLHIDWKVGERYFAQKLVDYDRAVNNGNWQWAASTGCDAQPWFRIFNPWLQQKKFDPSCVYIKKWVTELQGLSAEQIHRLELESFNNKYPRPIVDHKVEVKIAKEMFSSNYEMHQTKSDS